MNQYELGADRCPACGENFGAATNVTSTQPPPPGAFSVCFYCGALLRFRDDLTTRIASPEELAELCEREPEAWRALIKTRIAVLARAPGRKV